MVVKRMFFWAINEYLINITTRHSVKTNTHLETSSCEL